MSTGCRSRSEVSGLVGRMKKRWRDRGRILHNEKEEYDWSAGDNDLGVHTADGRNPAHPKGLGLRV